jgi:hypothetical protein
VNIALLRVQKYHLYLHLQDFFLYNFNLFYKQLVLCFLHSKVFRSFFQGGCFATILRQKNKVLFWKLDAQSSQNCVLFLFCRMHKERQAWILYFFLIAQSRKGAKF